MECCEYFCDLCLFLTQDVCLAGFGRRFAPSDPGMFKVNHGLYKLSKKIDHFHAFLSHDWNTSRWLKLMYPGGTQCCDLR